jgi:hypothetical protein
MLLVLICGPVALFTLLATDVNMDNANGQDMRPFGIVGGILGTLLGLGLMLSYHRRKNSKDPNSPEGAEQRRTWAKQRAWLKGEHPHWEELARDEERSYEELGRVHELLRRHLFEEALEMMLHILRTSPESRAAHGVRELFIRRQG